MNMPRPRKNCPYCGSFKLRVKEWRSHGTWFVACTECAATGPSNAKSPQEACDLFDHRAVGMEQVAISWE